jgi:hypothetical protein
VNTWQLTYNGTEECGKAADLPTQVTYTVDGGSINYIFVGTMGAYIAQADPTKPTDGNGEFSLSINMALTNYTWAKNLAVCRKGTKGATAEFPCDPQQPQNFYYYELDSGATGSDLVSTQNYTRASGVYSENQASIYTFKAIRPGSWELYYMYNTPKQLGHQTLPREKTIVNTTGISFEINTQGGIYVIAVTGDKTSAEKRKFQVASYNTINLLWQVPQYIIVTVAEILFSITGYEFAYSQSAPSMKALLQALWLLTIAVGDSVIVAVALTDPFDTLRYPTHMFIQFVSYGVAMLVVMVIFALISIFYYEYNYYTGDKEENNSDTTSTSSGDHHEKNGSIAELLPSGELKHRKGTAMSNMSNDVWKTKL